MLEYRFSVLFYEKFLVKLLLSYHEPSTCTCTILKLIYTTLTFLTGSNALMGFKEAQKIKHLPTNKNFSAQNMDPIDDDKNLKYMATLSILITIF